MWFGLPWAAECCLVVTVTTKSLHGHKGQHLLPLIQNDLQGHHKSPKTIFEFDHGPNNQIMYGPFKAVTVVVTRLHEVKELLL